jgi:hypothetical protein
LGKGKAAGFHSWTDGFAVFARAARLAALAGELKWECPLLAQSGHHANEFQCPLLGVKRTSEECAAMSAKADIGSAGAT